jgi:hypothetical protein
MTVAEYRACFRRMIRPTRRSTASCGAIWTLAWWTCVWKAVQEVRRRSYIRSPRGGATCWSSSHSGTFSHSHGQKSEKLSRGSRHELQVILRTNLKWFILVNTISTIVFPPLMNHFVVSGSQLGAGITGISYGAVWFVSGLVTGIATFLPASKAHANPGQPRSSGRPGHGRLFRNPRRRS